MTAFDTAWDLLKNDIDFSVDGVSDRIDVARWESRTGRWFVQLYKQYWNLEKHPWAKPFGLAYGYTGVDAGGNLGIFGRDFGHGMSEDSADDVAIQMMSEKVSMFQPDANTTPMQIRDDGGWGV